MFCTTCGASVSEQQDFCTTCGSSRSKKTDSNQEVPRIEASASAAAPFATEMTSTSKSSKAKRALAVTAVALVGLVLGTALTAAGLTEFAIGARYTQSELDVEKRDSEKRGYERGDEAGYERGYSAGQSDGYDTGYDSGQKAGYSAGLIRGCNNVFDEIGENLIAIRYPWYKINVYGYYWNRNTLC